MKIAVSSTGKKFDSQLDQRFGRCAYYLVVDSSDMSFEVYSNESAAKSGGAGIQAAQFLASKNVQAVITGNCGPNAAQTLSAAGIELFAGNQGTVKNVVEKFVNGGLKSANGPTVDSHFGMKTGTRTGRGRGMGGGKGLGRGFSARGSQGIGNTREDEITGNNELESLRAQAERLNQQMKDILARINTLEKK